MEKEENVEQNIREKKINLQNPIFFGSIITSIFIFFLILTTILETFLNIKVYIAIPATIHLFSITIFGLVYRYKYHEKVPKYLS